MNVLQILKIKMNTLPILAHKKQVKVASVLRLLPLDPNAKPDELIPVKRMDFTVEEKQDEFVLDSEYELKRAVLKDSLAQNHHFVKYCGFWVDLFEYDFLVHIIGKTTLEPQNKTIRKGYCMVWHGVLVENGDLFDKLHLFDMGLISKKQLILEHGDFIVFFCRLQQIKQQAEKG